MDIGCPLGDVPLSGFPGELLIVRGTNVPSGFVLPLGLALALLTLAELVELPGGIAEVLPVEFVEDAAGWAIVLCCPARQKTSAKLMYENNFFIVVFLGAFDGRTARGELIPSSTPSSSIQYGRKHHAIFGYGANCRTQSFLACVIAASIEES